ncbi:hypothetical protein [Histidinibacterium lentulum]|uniref:DUF2818 family protein n=1 Tax=Histidinibacterium lentulum TaxID=2480588 RepID=A0A3N2R9P0_9RHOB|nr:hypothetical protein [Histidinibacterium lentulum]ROU04137.1 hypothetical protein EAT49_01690 [Histidinibacterium lentulum]
MPPEAVLLCINAAFLAFGYFWVYPGLEEKTALAISLRDVAITGAALLVAGLLYAGHGLRFDLLFVETRWWVFSFLTMLAMEMPLFFWFTRRHGIDWSDYG